MPWPKGKPMSPEHIAKRSETLVSRGSRRKKPLVIDAVTMWQCPKCQRWLTEDRYYASSRSANGLTSQCRDCHTEGNLRTRDRDLARDSNRTHMQQARARDPEKFRERARVAARKRPWDEKREARYQLNLAVRRGEVDKPPTCEECGSACDVTGHHDDYGKPLEVRWLCYVCHGKLHRHD